LEKQATPEIQEKKAAEARATGERLVAAAKAAKEAQAPTNTPEGGAA
jgi:hypothetical protein